MPRSLVTFGPTLGLLLALSLGTPASADDESDGVPPAIRVADAADGPTYADKPVSFWIGELADKATAEIAKGVLQRFGTAAVPQLGAALLSEDALTRYGAITVLGRLKGADLTPLIPVLSRTLFDAHRDVRRTSAVLLGGLGPRAVVALPALARLIDDKDSKVRPGAVDAIGKIGSASGEGVEFLARAMRNTATTIYGLRALRAYGGAGAAALPEVLAVLDDPASKLHLEALLTAVPLAPGDERVVGHLRRMLASQDVKERRSVVQLLEPVGAAGVDVTEDLRLCLGDADAAVSNAALRVITRVPAVVEGLMPALPGLLERLTLRDWRLVANILAARTDEELVPLAPGLLGAYLRMGDRHGLLKLLQRLGPHAAEAAVEFLLSASPRPEDSTAAKVYDASLVGALHIVTTCDPSGVVDGRERLRGIVGDVQRPSVLRTALLASFASAGDDPRLSESLVSLLIDPDAAVRASANFWIGQVRADAVPTLVAALRDGPESLRLAVIAHAPSYGHFPEVEQAIAACAAEGSAEVRSASIELLMSRLESGDVIRPSRAAALVAPSVKRLLHEGSDAALLEGLRRLGALGELGLEELPRLVRTLGDTDTRFRETAAASILRLAAADRQRVNGELDRVLVDGGLLQRATAARVRCALEPAPDRDTVMAVIKSVLSGTEDTTALRAALGVVEVLGTDPATLGSLVGPTIARISHAQVAGDAARVASLWRPLPDAAWLSLRELARGVELPGHAVAFGAMAELGERGVAEIVAALDDDGGARRIMAIGLIGGLRQSVSGAVQDRIRNIAVDASDPHRLEARKVALAWQRQDEGREGGSD